MKVETRMKSVLRCVQSHRTKDSVPRPEMIKDYIFDMGGVDLLDQKTAAYRLDRKFSGD